ncbi:MAG: GNAT family N-acetyltransferase [Thermoclostridium sp.]|nr:GNAT family N-acetyltransferase [Thermoclostridium sp.]
MELVFRKADRSELPAALSLLKEAAVWLKHKKIDYWQSWLDPAPEYIKWIQSGFEKDEFTFVFCGEELVGMFRLQYSDEFFWGKKDDKAGYIHSFTTVRALKGKGIGKAILNHIQNSLIDQGIDFLRLDCSSNVEGLCRYYESNGFKPSGTVSLFGDTLMLYEKEFRSNPEEYSKKSDDQIADVILVHPTKEYEEKAMGFIREFHEYHSEINGTGGLDRFDDYDQWLMKVQKDLDWENIPEGRVPANTYFLVRAADNRILGMINIRHKLNDFLLREGGHIGYSIRPTERNKGYATKMLSLGLARCKELNINRVLITCDRNNPASARVIQNNHGVLENEAYSETFSEVIQRYWIEI